MNFDRCSIIVGGSSLIAENASLSSKNSQNPIKSVGFRGQVASSAEGSIENDISISYLVETNREPVLDIVNSLKFTHNDLIYNPTVVSIAGISGSFYLTDYSLKIIPNEVIRASASFKSFLPVTGDLTEDSVSSFDATNASGLAHAWTTRYLLNGEICNNTLLESDYSFSANWEPVYTFGSKYPNQVQFINGEEEVSITRDVYKTVQFTGQNMESVHGLDAIKFNSISLLASFSNPVFSLTVPISGLIHADTQVNASMDDIVRVTTVFSKEI